jgi:uncharacterized protein YjlB
MPEAPTAPAEPDADRLWYGVHCVRCQQFIHFLHLPGGPGSGDALHVERGALLNLTCGACHQQAKYPAEAAVVRAYVPPGGWGPVVARARLVASS